MTKDSRKCSRIGPCALGPLHPWTVCLGASCDDGVSYHLTGTKTRIIKI